MSSSTIEGTTLKGNMNNSLPELKAFKRAPSLGLSQWENGNLTTNLAEKEDTNGAFFLVEATLAPGTEPPPQCAYARGRTLLRSGRRVRGVCRRKSFQRDSGGMRLSSQIQAARFCDPLAAASRPRAVHPRGIGRSLPRHEFARPTSGTSRRSRDVFDGGAKSDGTTTQ